MNVTLTISKEYAEPQINIYAPETTADINKLISYIQNAEKNDCRERRRQYCYIETGGNLYDLFYRPGRQGFL